MNRTSVVTRDTLETKVRVELNLDGTGTSTIVTGVGFFDHLLTLLAFHALFDLTVETHGDLEVDDHHTVEDTALAVGEAFADAIGSRRGVYRYGSAAIPMDEALAKAAVDVGGRPYSVIDLSFSNERIGNLTTQNISHALESFSRTAGVTIHLSASGHNDHHVAEAAFKALAQALCRAVESDPRRIGVPSTKGTT